MNNKCKPLNFTDFSKIYKSKIVESIDFHISMLYKEVLSSDPIFFELDIHTHLSQYMKRGKLWRAILMLYWLYLYVDDNKFKSVYVEYMPLAVSMEFLQAFLLAHDDIIDDDDMRRNMPSMHMAIAQVIQKKTGLSISECKKAGKALTICVGDILYSFALEIASRLIPASYSSTEEFLNERNILTEISKSISIVGMGQMKDVYWSYKNISNSNEILPKEILRMYEQKTGSYTFVLPSLLGLYVASHHVDIDNFEQERNTLENLGKVMGIMFQIQDDVIGVRSSFEVTGKSRGIDFVEKTYTYLWSSLMSKLLSEQHASIREEMQSIWNNTIGDKEVDKILACMEVHGVFEDIKKIQIENTKIAKQYIANLSLENEYKEVLEVFLETIIFRKN